MTTNSGFDRTDVARCWAGFASFGAGLVHIAVVGEHFAVSLSHGIFFAVLGLAQVGWALWALSRTSVPIPRITAGASVAVIALWAVSRTVSISVGPLTLVREPAGTPDLIAVALQTALIACILVAMPWRATVQSMANEPRPASSAATARLVGLLAAGALAVSGVATPAMAATAAGEHAHGHGGGHSEHPSGGGGHHGSPSSGDPHRTAQQWRPHRTVQ